MAQKITQNQRYRQLRVDPKTGSLLESDRHRFLNALSQRNMKAVFFELLPDDGSMYWEIQCDPRMVARLRSMLAAAMGANKCSFRTYSGFVGATLQTTLVVPKRLIERNVLTVLIEQANALRDT